ncbi:MAG TPA: hypothetical protein VFM77_09840 [Terriglobales bacterium]|nr:hypothetical protein [Terriglobales bacterium]
MNSSDDIIRELEFKRRALNERLMNAKDVAEANSIERELWAVRARIRYHKTRAAKGVLPRSPEAPAQDASEANPSG